MRVFPDGAGLNGWALQSDPRLTPLRETPEFKAFMREIEAMVKLEG